MKIKVDSKRRIELPTLFADELNIKKNSVVNVDLKDKKIIITKCNNFDLKEYIEILLQSDISFETFELMVENLVIDGYKFVDIIEELEY